MNITKNHDVVFLIIVLAVHSYGFIEFGAMLQNSITFEGKQQLSKTKTSDITSFNSNIEHYDDDDDDSDYYEADDDESRQENEKKQSSIAIDLKQQQLQRRQQHRISLQPDGSCSFSREKCTQFDEFRKSSKNLDIIKAKFNLILSEKQESIDSCYYSSDSIFDDMNDKYLCDNNKHKRSESISKMSSKSFVYGLLTRRWHDAWLSTNNRERKEIQASNNDDDIISKKINLLSKQPNNNENNSITYQRRLIRDIQSKYNQIDLYPTESQIYEMIQFASKCSRRRTLHTISAEAAAAAAEANSEKNFNVETGLTFGEFCYFASVLITSDLTSRYRPPISNNHMPMMRLVNEPHCQPHYTPALTAALSHFNNRKNSQSAPIHYSFPHLRSGHQNKFDIFLGGSCNPTRWRSDLVMPELKKHCYTYYNPQVDHWGPELIEMETYAKQNSEVLYFVVDNQTRAIASMIEVAFIAASFRKLILVIVDMEPWSEQMTIGDDYISKEEYEYLRRGRQYLRDIVERQEIPIFCDIFKALRSAIQILEKNLRPQDLEYSEDVTPVKNGHISLGEKIIQIYTAYDQTKNPNGDFTMNEVRFAYRHLNKQELTTDLLRQIARWHLEQKSSDKSVEIIPPFDQIPLDFNDFCIIVAELDVYFNRVQNEMIDDNEVMQNNEFNAERISEGTENSEDSSTSKDETDSDSCRTLNSKKPKAKSSSKKKCSDNNHGHKRSNNMQNESSNNTFFNQMFERVSTLIKSISLDSGYGGSNNNNNDSNDSIKKDKMQKHVTKMKKKSSKIRKEFAVESDMIEKSHKKLYNHQAPSAISNEFFYNPYSLPPEDYLMQSSLSLNQSNLENDYRRHYPHIHQQHPHINYHLQQQQYSRHQLQSYHLNPQQLYHYRTNPHRNSVSPMRKSSSPRLAYMDQSNIAFDDDHYFFDNRRRSFYQQQQQQQHHPSSVYPPNLPPLPNMMSASSQTSINSMIDENYDLYLGGFIDSTLLHDKIAPLLKKNSITYRVPKFDRNARYERMTPLEAMNIRKCRFLLFVIPEDSFDISSMIVAAHYVGLGCKVILCIQNINPISSKLASKLSPIAIKDYNRGRSYLSDMATKSHKPVYNNIDEAIECCIDCCLGRKQL